ncbi:hypothetical protein ACD591_19460 [Rufibacter glacialis]|uniref:Uncharacterized protein n=1 Tax=Rufibacter glacialis TaxID=1259555 RepID=A0A5M8Q320_9BACT|nr:hypothetical protein [Rufibacter glacialis]KAA6430229.1 hypothetical protein FOE74_20655 [Rufibacter glacialis]GGK87521.1 hypothetical protein GCM10011405_39060 [Rufibacter glacialis]
MEENKRNQYIRPGQGGDAENHQRGRELYQRDQQRHQQNPQQQHRPEDRHWDAGNHFHTGYSNQTHSHFPEDTHERTSNADRGASLSKHYGQQEYSAYRNPDSLNYGDGRGNSTYSGPQQGRGFAGSQNSGTYSSHGDGRGNYSARQDSYGQGHENVHPDNRISEQRRRDDTNENYYRGGYMESRGVRTELPRPDDNPYNDWPGGRSRYKDDDYRYGSGNHTWYDEHRYTDNNGRRADRDKGDVLGDMGEGVREAWQDMKHGVRNLFNRNSDQSQPDHDSRRHDHEYRSPQDRGTERGPRWSDETDSGDDDSRHYNRDHNPRRY